MRRSQLIAGIAIVTIVTAFGTEGGVRAASSAPAYYTTAQAAHGGAVYAAKCAQCHGARLQGLTGPALTGAAIHGTQTIADIDEFVTTQMPLGAPGSLSPADYAAVMAYLLRKNGHPAGKTALTPAKAKAITAPF